MDVLNESVCLKPYICVAEKKPADFETAITATGFGRFNIILILISIPSGWSSIFETTTMSYVFPAAQCDLSLTLDNKGFLNAITYIGKNTVALFRHVQTRDFRNDIERLHMGFLVRHSRPKKTVVDRSVPRQCVRSVKCFVTKCDYSNIIQVLGRLHVRMLIANSYLLLNSDVILVSMDPSRL
jgi:hypothetical protein